MQDHRPASEQGTRGICQAKQYVLQNTGDIHQQIHLPDQGHAPLPAGSAHRELKARKWDVPERHNP